MACERCGYELRIGDFPFCKGSASDHQGGIFSVIPDDIPGGIDIHHGICNDDGSPRRYYSKSEITRAAKAKGYHNHVEHITDPTSGSDRNKFTTRWI